MNTLNTTKIAVGMFGVAVSSFFFAGVNLQRKYSLLKKTPIAYYMERQPITGVSGLVNKVNNATNIKVSSEAGKEVVVSAFKIQEGINTLNYPITPGVVFRVQVLASQKQMSNFPPELKELNLKVGYEKGMYKYTVGEFKSPAQTEDLLNSLAILGYNDSFVVAFKDGKPIEVAKAIKEIKPHD